MGAVPRPELDLFRKIKDLEDAIANVRNASAWFNTGMHPNGEGGLDSDNYNPGVSGYSFGADGDAEFNAIVLRQGSVAASALASPYVPGVAGTERTAFPLTPTATEVAGVDLVIPEGCTRLALSATGHVYVENPGASADALWCFVRVVDVAATPLGVPLPPSSQATGSSSLATSLTGLEPSSTLRLGVWAATSVSALAASSTHTAVLAASLTWRP